MDKSIDRIVSHFEKYVTRVHFDAIISQMQSDQAELKRDVKEILVQLNKLIGSKN